MSEALLVLKLGGDAVATPALIARAASLIARERATRPVVVITSARRGVTDHLLGLWHQVAAAAPQHATATSVAAERAIASGEVVTASLLAGALCRLAVDAVPLDAREAGIRGDGPVGAARIRRIRTRFLQRHLTAGRVPVVAGFQVDHRGHIRTLGRGGSDVTAVAIAAALGAGRCRFLKLHGLRTADPKSRPDATPVGSIGYAALRTLLDGGAQVLHPDAARLAERHGVRLEFVALDGGGEVSVVTAAIGERRSAIGGQIR